MAKFAENIDQLCNRVISDAQKGEFKPLYLLMGEESYYPDKVCQAIIQHCISPEDKDFNESILYGTEVGAEQVISCARRYPMMSDRQLVVLKEAQLMKGIEGLSVYCESPLDSTVLVVLLHGAKLDKRTALYKAFAKNGIVIESPVIKDYEVPGWTINHFKSLGLDITPDAAALLGEYAGTDLVKIASEADKLIKNLPEGATSINATDIEKNVGISRQFSIFELTKELNFGRNGKALEIAGRLSSAAKFSMPAAIAMLFTDFQRILKYNLLLSSGNASPEKKAKVLAGVHPYFYKEYDSAVKIYPLRNCIEVISLLCDYDYFSKGGSPVTQDELFVELISKILGCKAGFIPSR